MDDFYLREETYKIIGLCMEVYNILGKGHSEVVYKDALEYEFQMNDIPYEREKIYMISYKDIFLPRKYTADFVVYDKIIFEVKAISQLTTSDIKQTLNYLASSKNKFRFISQFWRRQFEIQKGNSLIPKQTKFVISEILKNP